MNEKNSKRRYLAPFIFLTVLAVIALIPVDDTTPHVADAAINGADTAWMLMASALVLLMTPGLAFFYGGMVRYKNLVSTLLQSFITLGIISVIWIVVGFSLAFGDSIGGFIGNPLTFFMFKNVELRPIQLLQRPFPLRYLPCSSSNLRLSHRLSSREDWPKEFAFHH
jgi:Amt family ammonium transporter